jgi:tetratricopeptide (TPR) repeat protein
VNCHERFVPNGTSRQLAAFEQAIDKDPTFAPAFSGLAAAHAFRSGFDRFSSAERADEISHMRSAAERALQLDPSLAEAHTTLGIVYARDAQWGRSEKSFRSAVELGPSTSLVRNQFVENLLLPLGRTGEAVVQMRLAAKSDPLSPFIQGRETKPFFRPASGCPSVANRS